MGYFSMVGPGIRDAVEREISDYPVSRLAQFVSDCGGPYAIKFVSSQWAAHYASPKPLKISTNPALTWGTATYVTPLVFPLSSALYGRIGVVTDFAPAGWRIFDATRPSAQRAYINWARSQAICDDLLLTVHSTDANHKLRNHFRQAFRIDCVLFHPDQEAEAHTDKTRHVWMAVTDWAQTPATELWTLETLMSSRLSNARFTVLIDEDFQLQTDGLPIRTAARQIERTAALMHQAAPNPPIDVSRARIDPTLPQQIANVYQGNGYLHLFIES